MRYPHIYIPYTQNIHKITTKKKTNFSFTYLVRTISIYIYSRMPISEHLLSAQKKRKSNEYRILNRRILTWTVYNVFKYVHQAYINAMRNEILCRSRIRINECEIYLCGHIFMGVFF